LGNLASSFAAFHVADSSLSFWFGPGGLGCVIAEQQTGRWIRRIYPFENCPHGSHRIAGLIAAVFACFRVP
jgi:hypothetical protein